MKLVKTIALTSFAVLLSTAALAATANSVSSMENGSSVSLSGTVEDFNGAKSFTLRDASGTVKVDLSSAKSVVLKNGEKVDVSGSVNKGILENTVVATNIKQDQSLGQQVGDAINSVTGDSPGSNATQVSVKGLPASGLVQLKGTVDRVSNSQKFTLRDSTGTVDVALQSGANASLHKGSGVTVIGYVDNGMLGKSINATQVEVKQ